MSRLAPRILKGSLATLAVVFGAIAVLAAALALVNGNHLRGPLAGFIARHTGRQIRIDGPLSTHLLSLHPSLIAEHLTVGNPPWTPPGTMAAIGKLTVVLDLPLFGHPFAIQRLAMEGADLHLQRDAAGHANWYLNAPGILPGKGAPIIHSLSVTTAHVALDDDRRHLLFDGTVTAGDATKDAAGSLRIEGKGHLNGRDATFTIDGEPLAAVAPEKPYHFTFNERSSGSQLVAHGSVLQPFDFRGLEASFEAGGADLKDLFFLIGVWLPNTASYRLSGKLSRQGTLFRLSDLLVTSGQSDIGGALASRMDSNGKSRVEVELHSQRLRMADLGARAAGRAGEPPAAGPLLLPETEIRVDDIRSSDAVVNFRAHAVEAGRLVFHTVGGHMSIDDGTVTVPLLSAAVAEGKVSARIEFDAKHDIPTAKLELDMVNIRLGQLASKDPARPPLDGSLQGRLILAGHGRSIHEIAASANGKVMAIVPQGEMRASLAELTGLDLRALGLMLTGDKRDTAIRCGVGNFKAHEGTLTAQTLVIDTDPVLITGSGSIHFDSETLDLRLYGEPKERRLLRLRAPVAIHGTLAHPSFGIEKGHRKLELLDPGHGEDVDCATLLAQAKSGELPAGGGPSERD